MSNLRSLLTEIQRLLLNWLRRDRIRVAPSEGRLLRVRVGDRLMVDGQLFQVDSRSISVEPLATQVSLGISSLAAMTKSVVQLEVSTSLTTKVFRVTKWTEGADVTTIREDEVFVLEPHD